MNEHLTKAAHDAGFLLDGLRQANNNATPVESIILIELITRAVELEARIKQFQAARAA